MKYSKNIVHLKPFIDATKELVPHQKINYIRGYKVNKKFNFISYGSTIQTKNTFNINILTHEYNVKIKKYQALRIYNMLDTLSHELAHTVYWEHTQKHYQLQAQIQMKFCKVLKELGIMDTEIRHNKIGSEQ